MNGLMLHTGARTVDLGALFMAPTPERTATHVPIPHHDLLKQVKHNIGQTGSMEIVEEAHGLSPDGNRYFGLLGLKDRTAPSNDFQLTIGLRNSHDKTFPA